MKHSRPRSFLVLFCLVAATPACVASGAAVPEERVNSPEPAEPFVATAEPAMARPPRALGEDGNFYVLGADAAHPRVRYLDGQLARNETCAIQLGNKLNRRIPPMYVNGEPIGFC